MRKLVLVGLVLLLTGCSANVQPKPLSDKKGPYADAAFVQMSNNLFCDTEYNVQYIWVYDGAKDSGMSVRMDSEGKPVPCK